MWPGEIVHLQDLFCKKLTDISIIIPIISSENGVTMPLFSHCTSKCDSSKLQSSARVLYLWSPIKTLDYLRVITIAYTIALLQSAVLIKRVQLLDLFSHCTSSCGSSRLSKCREINFSYLENESNVAGYLAVMDCVNNWI